MKRNSIASMDGSLDDFEFIYVLNWKHKLLTLYSYIKITNLMEQSAVNIYFTAFLVNMFRVRLHAS
jgi:uncharacterized hydantoinase/oxoprolinase family protein